MKKPSNQPTGDQIYAYRLLNLKCREVNANYVSTRTPRTRKEYSEAITAMYIAIRAVPGHEKDSLKIQDLKYLDNETKSKLAVALDAEKELLPPTDAQLTTFEHLVNLAKERHLPYLDSPKRFTRAQYRVAVLYMAQVINGPTPAGAPNCLTLIEPEYSEETPNEGENQ